MELKVGSVVISKAGRDKGRFLAVMRIEPDGVYVSDGKERPVERPKKKNPVHLQKTHYTVSEAEAATNRSLKRALRLFAVPDEREVK